MGCNFYIPLLRERGFDMTKFYIVRHGQSEGNATRRFLGHTDLGLTELGHKQGRKTAEYLKDKGIDAIYSSDLVRAYDTAKYLGDLIGIEPIKTKGLREIFAGEWEGRELTDILANYENYQVWLGDFGNVRCDGGESTFELQQRIEKELKRIAGENESKTVMIATHAAAIRVMCCIWLGIEVSEAKNLTWVTNASVTDVTYDNGKWILGTIGYDEHLTGLISKVPPNV